MASDYPLMMRLAGRRCVVVGGGSVGLRKVRGLLAAGAEVALIDPQLEPELLPAGVQGHCRPFQEDDLDTAFLAFAATDDAKVNRSVATAARKRRIPVNIADDLQGSDFILPASFTRGALQVAVGTGGRSPAVAAIVRDEIDGCLSGSWESFLDIAAKLRCQLLTTGDKAAYNQQVLQNLITAGLLEMIGRADEAAIDGLLAENLGTGFSLAGLGVSLSKGST